MACEHCNGTGEITWPTEDGGSPPMVCPHCDQLRMVKCEECEGKGCGDCDGKGEYAVVYCHACSDAGGSGCGVFHGPPACPLDCGYRLANSESAKAT